MVQEYLLSVKQVVRDYHHDASFNSCYFCNTEVNSTTDLYWYYEKNISYKTCATCYVELIEDDCQDCYDSNFLCDDHNPIEHPSLVVDKNDRINTSPSDTLMAVEFWKEELRINNIRKIIACSSCMTATYTYSGKDINTYIFTCDICWESIGVPLDINTEEL